MLFDDTAFLHSLASWAAPRATTSLGVAVTYGTNLFTNLGTDAADPVAVLRVYGGKNDATNPKPTAAVQLEVIGSDVVATKRMAQAIFESIVTDVIGREARMVLIANVDPVTNAAGGGNWMIVNATTVARPGQLGVDERGRVRVVANFDLGFYRTL